MDDIFIDNNGIKYLIDEYGEMYFISDRKVKRRITQEDDHKFYKWEQYNLNMARKGGKTIECYEEFLVDVLDCVLSVDEERILEEYRKQQSYIKYMKSKSEFDILIRDNLGAFCFNIYKNLLDINLEPQYEFRFIYLCTYMNYDNKLVLGNQIGDGKLATESDLTEILRLSQRETINTKNALIKANLITIEEDKTISINKKYAIKGKISKRALKGSVRIMENGLKTLYESVSAKEHKKVDVFIKLLPYVNYDYNILCSNPSENNINKIKPLTIKEVCEIVCYDVNNQSKFKRDLLKLTIDNKKVVAITQIGDEHAISINPMIYYKGNKIEALKYLLVLFKTLDK